MVGLMVGKVMDQKRRSTPAPSISAASYSDGGTERIEARKIIAVGPTPHQVITANVGKAVLGSPNQLTGLPPTISPTIFFNVVMGLIGSFQYFTNAYLLTAGGPMRETLFYNLYLFQIAFRYLKMGYACSLAWFLFVIILVLTLLVFRSSSVWVYYETEVK
jgi:hypothetical protein